MRGSIAARTATSSLAWFLTGSRAGAEDVLHDAFSGLVVRFEGVELAENAHLRRSVVNGAQNWKRNERRHRERLHLVEPLEHEDGAARELLAAALALPYRQRVVIVARCWGGWSESEIADALGCRPGTVKSLAARALGRLRKEFSA